MMRVRIREERWHGNSKGYIQAHRGAVKKSLNKAAIYAHGAFAQSVKETTGIKKGRARQGLARVSAKTKLLRSQITTRPKSPKRLVGLHRFRPKQNARGVATRGLYNDPKTQFDSAFIVKGDKTDARRNGLVWRRVGRSRLPVRYPATVYVRLNIEKVGEEIKRANAIRHEEYHRELGRRLRRQALRRL